LKIPVEVGVDLPTYESLVASWLPRLRAAARAKATRSLSFKAMDASDPELKLRRDTLGALIVDKRATYDAIVGLAPRLWMGPPSPYIGNVDRNRFEEEVKTALFSSRGSPPSRQADLRTVAIISNLSRSGRASVESLSIDKDVFCRLWELVGGPLSLNATVLDGSGKEISGRNQTFDGSHVGVLGAVIDNEVYFGRVAEGTYSYGTAIVVYPGNYEHKSAYTTTWHGSFSLSVASDELQSLSSIRLTLTLGASAAYHYTSCQ
jgi:hypothetical protein